MHCHGYRVESTEDLIPTLERAFANTDAPSVVVVPVDYSANMELTETLRAEYE
jgi:acetolactate synthase I/II/III large subunit